MLQNKSKIAENYENINIEEFQNINFKGVRTILELEKLLTQKNVTEITKNVIKDILAFKEEFNIKGNSISWTIGKILKLHKESENKHNFSIYSKYPLLKEGKKLYLEKISDSLTGLKNKKFAEEKIWKLIEKKEREKNFTFSIIVIDIDYFKKINDTFGHQVGDIALKGITKILKENFRKTDTIARWGGEEFLIITEDLNNEQVEKKAAQLRFPTQKELITYIRNEDNKDQFCKKRVNGSCKRKEACENGKAECFDNSVTISAGVATIRETDEGIESETRLIKRADMALYEAKNKGRNIVINGINYK